MHRWIHPCLIELDCTISWISRAYKRCICQYIDGDFAFHLDFVVARSCSTLFGLLAAVSKVAMMNESNFKELIFYVATVALAVDVVSRNDAGFWYVRRQFAWLLWESWKFGFCGILRLCSLLRGNWSFAVTGKIGEKVEVDYAFN